MCFYVKDVFTDNGFIV